DGAVTDTKLADNAVKTAKIDAGAVTTVKLADEAVTAAKLADGSVSTAKLVDEAVTADKLAGNSVTEAKIADNAVTNGKLAANAVSTAKIEDGAVTGAKIEDGTITAGKLATGAVTSNAIESGAVETDDIKDKAVTAAKLADNSVNTNNIVNLAVVTDKIADKAVTNGKLADDAVTTDKIKDGEVKTADIADKNVTTAKLADGAVTGTQLAANAVESTHIVDGSIATADLADNSVTSIKIKDGEVNTEDLADGAVTADKLGPNAVTASSIADEAITPAKLKGQPTTANNVIKLNSTGDGFTSSLFYDNGTDAVIDGKLYYKGGSIKPNPMDMLALGGVNANDDPFFTIENENGNNVFEVYPGGNVNIGNTSQNATVTIDGLQVVVEGSSNPVSMNNIYNTVTESDDKLDALENQNGEVHISFERDQDGNITGAATDIDGISITNNAVVIDKPNLIYNNVDPVTGDTTIVNISETVNTINEALGDNGQLEDLAAAIQAASQLAEALNGDVQGLVTKVNAIGNTTDNDVSITYNDTLSEYITTINNNAVTNEKLASASITVDKLKKSDTVQVLAGEELLTIDGGGTAFKTTPVSKFATATALNELSGTVAGHTNDIANINTALDSKADAADLEALETTVAGHTTAISGIDTRLGTAESNITNLGNTKADKDYVDEQLALKADQSALETLAGNVYTKTEVNDALALKANAADVYTKDQVYTKGETDAAITTALGAYTTTADLEAAYLTKTEAGNTYLTQENAATTYATISTVSGIDTRLTTAEGKITSLETTVGSANGGLVKDVADNAAAITELQTTIGDAQSGLVKGVADNATAITELQTTIGDENSGLVKQVNTNTSNIALNADITYVDTELAKYVPLATTGDVTFSGTTSTIGAGKVTTAMLAGGANFVNGDLVTVDGDGFKTTSVNDITNGLETRVGALETTVNTATTGLKDRVTTLETTVAGHTTDISNLQSGKADKTYVDEQLALKADKSALETLAGNVYTKDQVYTKTETNTAITTALENYTTTTDLNTALAAKADKSTTYTKTEVDNLVNAKANSSDVYTKSETNNAITTALEAYTTTADLEATYATTTALETGLAGKADADNVYTKAQADGLLDAKADKSTTYTKTDVDTKLAGYVTTSSLTTTLSDYATTTALETGLAGKADKTALEALDTKVGNLVGDKGDVTIGYTNDYTITIDNDAVTTAKIADGNVTPGKLAGTLAPDGLVTVNSNGTGFTTTTLNSITTGLEGRVTALETTVNDPTTGLVKKVTDNTTDITNLQSGKADQSALEALAGNVYTKDQVYTKGETDAAITTALGAYTTTADLQATYATIATVNTLTGQVETNTDDITTLKGIVGDENSGLVKQVNTLETNVAGNTQNISTLDAKLDKLSGDLGDITVGYANDVYTAVIDNEAVTKAKLAGGSNLNANDVLAVDGNGNFVKANVYTANDVYTKTETNTLLAGKADLEAFNTLNSTVTHADTGLVKKVADLQTTVAGKADANNVYTKGEIDSKVSTINATLETKANIADVYTQAQADAKFATTTALETGLAGKADKTDLNAYLTTADAESTYATIATVNQKASQSDLETLAGNVYTKDQVYTKSETNNAITTALGAYTTTADLQATYATQQALNDGLATKASKTELVGNHGDVTIGYENDVYTTSINENAVTTGKIADANVTAGKLALGTDFAQGGILSVDANNNFVKANVYTTNDVYTKDEADGRFAAKSLETTVAGHTTDISNLQSGKADKTALEALAGNVYTKDQVYTKTETNTAITTALENYTTTTDLNTALNAKADKSDTYTKAEVNTELAKYVPLTTTGDVTFSGTTSTIGEGKVTSTMIANGTIAAEDLANEAVTVSKLAKGNNTLSAGGLVTVDGTTGNFKTTAIDDILPTNLNNRVTALEATVNTATTGLKDRVTTLEGTVNSATIGNVKLDERVTANTNNIADLTTQVGKLVGDKGDVTISYTNDYTLTIDNGAVGTDKLAAGAVTGAKIASNTITKANLAGGNALTAGDLITVDADGNFINADVTGFVTESELTTTLQGYATTTALDAKADASELANYLTKTEASNTYAPQSTTYTKTEVDNLVGAKANSADVYTKTQADDKFATKAALADKANQSDLATLQTTVAGHTTAIGDANSGLTKGVADNAAAISNLQSGKADKTELSNYVPLTTTGDVTFSGTTSTIVANAITSAKIADGTIAAEDLANEAVTVSKLAKGNNTLSAGGLVTVDGTTGNFKTTAIDDILPTNLNNRVTALEGTVGDAQSGLVKDVADLQSSLAAKADQSALETLQTTVAGHTTAIGDANSGLTKGVADNAAAISALQTSVNSKASQSDLTALTTRVGTAETNITNLTTDVNSLKTTVGNAQSGLVKDVAELQTTVANKANTADVYTKTAADEKFADKSTTYTKTEVDGLLAGKVNTSDLDNYVTTSSLTTTLSDYATNSALETGLAGKANASDVYTKGEVDTKLSDYVPLGVTGDVTFTSTTASIAANAVTSAKIADGNVTTAKLANNAVTPDKLSGTFTADKFVKVNAAGDGFETADITIPTDLTNRLSALETKANALGSTTNTDVSITYSNNAYTTSINNGAVGTAKLAANAVTSAKIANGTIAAEDLANNAVTTDKIADANVTPNKLAGVNNFSINGIVKINSNATGFTTTTVLDEITDGSLYRSKLAGGAAIGDGKVILAGVDNSNKKIVKESIITQDSDNSGISVAGNIKVTGNGTISNPATDKAVVVNDSLHVNQGVTVDGTLTVNGETIINTAEETGNINPSGKTVILITGNTQNRQLSNGNAGQIIYLISGQNTTYTIKNSNNQDIVSLPANKMVTLIYVGSAWHVIQ
ncbi:MAG: hypothetical protein IJK61_05645, partial [Bacteroidetes bacterium]|nr:hypothetical protein [Bacteroidota bacterium]